MEKKGFTLVELLAVISLLAIIFLLIVPKVQNIISQDKIKTNKLSISELINIAKNDCLDSNLSVCSYVYNTYISNNYQYDNSENDSNNYKFYRKDGANKVLVPYQNLINKTTGTIEVNEDNVISCLLVDKTYYKYDNGTFTIGTKCD